MNKKLLSSIIMLAALLGVVVSPLSASAASTNDPTRESILLTPTFKRYELDAGSTKADSIKILNDGQVAYTFVTYARPYSVVNESYSPDFVTATQNADAYKWVKFDQPSYVIEPGQTVEVPYTLRIPQNATPGGHYGVMFAETQADEQAGSIARKKRLGAILYVTVKGDVQLSGSFKSSDVPFFQFNAPLKISQRIANSGNSDFIAKSSVTVSDVFGSVKYKSLKESAVLPATTRAISDDWKNPAWIGLYKVDQSVQFLDSSKNSSGYVLLVPIWVYITLAVLILGRISYALIRRRAHKKKK